MSITGRYPNLGPQLLLDAGIPVIDGVGQDVMARVADGTVVRLDDETLYLGDQVIAKGTPLTQESVEAAMTEARAMVAVQIESFAENTLEFLRREHALLTEGIPAPQMDTDMAGRHVLVVVRGYHYREDLRRPAALHPRVQAGHDGGGRRRGRPDRGRLPARRHLRRHGLGLRRGAVLRRGARRARLPGRPRARAGPGPRARAWTPSPCPPRGRARTSRCWWPTPRARA